VLVRKEQQVPKVSIDLINAANLGIKDLSVNAEKNVIHRAEEFLRTIYHFSFKIKISKESLLNGLGSVVGSKVSIFIASEHRITKTSCKLVPSAM
jgi:hypothetical protein